MQNFKTVFLIFPTFIGAITNDLSGVHLRIAIASVKYNQISY